VFLTNPIGCADPLAIRFTAALVLWSNGLVPGVAATQPNIVWLVADDLGYGELGCQGNPQLPTPHIDSIAGRGVRFTSGYVTAPYCSASRAGFLTGRYQSRFGYDTNPIGARNEDPGVGLPIEQRTIAQHLHDVGYATALIGKWHLGGTAAYHPLRRGFDEFFGFLHEGHFYVPPPYRGVTTMLRRRVLPGGESGRWTSPDNRLILSTHMGHDEPAYDADNPLVRAGQPVTETEYLTDAFTREAVDFITRHRTRPFFLCLAYNAVHSPLQAQVSYMRRMAAISDVHRRIFAAMLANLDDSVGAVLRELQRHELEQRTLVFFFSDNGGPTRELTSSNAPLRGGKGNLYEGGIRVPYLMQWKGVIPAGQTCHAPMLSLDMTATSLRAAGIDVASLSLDGLDLLPLLTGAGTSLQRAYLFWRNQQQAALREGDWKLVRIPRQGSGTWELYNLAEDLAESTNLAGTHPGKSQQMQTRWTAVNATMAALGDIP
jgi:arylsulfatase B